VTRRQPSRARSMRWNRLRACPLAAVVWLLSMPAHAQDPPFQLAVPQFVPASCAALVADPVFQPRAAAQQRQDGLWASLKNLQAGPVTFDLGGQARLRFEHDEGFGIKGYEPAGQDDLLLTRLRVDVAARVRNGPRFFLQLQDARAFLTKLGEADFPVSSPIEDALDIRQLYAEWRRIRGGPFGFKVGRQQISYGDQRVFGPGNWGNTGRFAWDAATLTIDTDRTATDLWVGKYLLYKTDVWPNRSVDDFLTFVGYTQVRKLPFRLDLFYVLKHDSSGRVSGESGSGNLLSQTVGVQAEGTLRNTLDAAATFAVQRGRHGQDTLRASGANVRLGVTAPLAWKPRLGVQYTRGSGDSNPADGIHGTFDGVYGGRDIAFYGYLNLFFWANLRDAEIDVSVRPWRGLTVYLEHHRFSLDQAADAWYTTGLKAYRRDATGRSGTALGHELDLRAVLPVGPHIELMAGGGRFFPGRFVTRTGPAPAATWSFVQAGYTW